MNLKRRSFSPSHGRLYWCYFFFAVSISAFLSVSLENHVLLFITLNATLFMNNVACTVLDCSTYCKVHS